jgi:flagellar biosynthetic protein FliO
MDWFEQTAAVALVLAVLGACLWWLRRRGLAGIALPRSARRLESLERLPLGPNQTLHLIRLGDRTLLISASPAGCSLLDKFHPGEMPSEVVR